MRHLKNKNKSKSKSRSKKRSKNRRKLSRGIRRLRLDGGFDDLPKEIKICISKYNPTARVLFNLALISKENKDIYLSLAQSKNVKEQQDIQDKLNELKLKDKNIIAISLDEFKNFLQMPGITEVSFNEYYDGLEITINKFDEIILSTLELKLEEGQRWNRSQWMEDSWQVDGLDQKIFDFCLKEGNIKELTKFTWSTRFDESIRYNNLIIPSNLKELSITSMGNGKYTIPKNFLKDTNVKKLTIDNLESKENFEKLIYNLEISDKITNINIITGSDVPCHLKKKFEKICKVKNIEILIADYFYCY